MPRLKNYVAGARLADNEAEALRMAVRTERSTVSALAGRIIVEWLRQNGYFNDPKRATE